MPLPPMPAPMAMPTSPPWPPPWLPPATAWILLPLPTLPMLMPAPIPRAILPGPGRNAVCEPGSSWPLSPPESCSSAASRLFPGRRGCLPPPPNCGRRCILCCCGPLLPRCSSGRAGLSMWPAGRDCAAGSPICIPSLPWALPLPTGTAPLLSSWRWPGLPSLLPPAICIPAACILIWPPLSSLSFCWGGGWRRAPCPAPRTPSGGCSTCARRRRTWWPMTAASPMFLWRVLPLAIWWPSDPASKYRWMGSWWPAPLRWTNRPSPGKACRWTKAPATPCRPALSTAPAALRCAPAGWAPILPWRKSSAWWMPPRVRRRRCSDWPTGWRHGLCRRWAPWRLPPPSCGCFWGRRRRRATQC